MKRVIFIISALVVFFDVSFACQACLNDRDTLAEEVQGLPDVVQVITGRFERNPPLFYQIRIQRVIAELRSNPAILNDYDDVGVACDRLERDNEAIAWMAKKRLQLPAYDANDPALKEQWYRYYANIGTFRVHRWIRAGADRTKIREVQQARDEIAQAIAIKPDAHLGREKYQLQVMDWIIAGRSYRTETEEVTDGNGTHFYQEPDPRVFLASNINGNSRDAIRGLCGLIALGNAWESVDIFYALSQRLDRPQEAHIANLAKLRCAELIDHGQGMMMPGAPRGDALKKALKLDTSSSNHVSLDSDHNDYEQLRTEAEHWQTQRTAYMMTRLLAGRHPDTDPAFWNGYRDPGPPKLTIPWYRRITLWLRHEFGYSGAETITPILFIIICSCPFIALYLYERRSEKRRRESIGS